MKCWIITIASSRKWLIHVLCCLYPCSSWWSGFAEEIWFLLLVIISAPYSYNNESFALQKAFKKSVSTDCVSTQPRRNLLREAGYYWWSYGDSATSPLFWSVSLLSWRRPVVSLWPCYRGYHGWISSFLKGVERFVDFFRGHAPFILLRILRQSCYITNHSYRGTWGVQRRNQILNWESMEPVLIRIMAW